MSKRRFFDRAVAMFLRLSLFSRLAVGAASPSPAGHPHERMATLPDRTSQASRTTDKRGDHFEETEGTPRTQVRGAGRAMSPATVITLGRVTSVQADAGGAGNNIVADATNEPSIAVDLDDSGRMAIGRRGFASNTDSSRQPGCEYRHKCMTLRDID